jgi:hypothetical protein
MKKVVTVGTKKVWVRTLTAQESRDYAKAAAQALGEPVAGNSFFETTLAADDDYMVQQLSAELVERGIPEQAFFPCVDDLEALVSALHETENLDEPKLVANAWLEVNPAFLSRAKARKEDVAFRAIMSKWAGLVRKSEEGGSDTPIQ